MGWLYEKQHFKALNRQEGKRKEHLSMSRAGNHFQEKFMSLKFRGKEIFKPMNTGRIDEHVSCVREYIANIFFYTKNGKTIMIVSESC